MAQGPCRQGVVSILHVSEAEQSLYSRLSTLEIEEMARQGERDPLSLPLLTMADVGVKRLSPAASRFKERLFYAAS